MTALAIGSPWYPQLALGGATLAFGLGAAGTFLIRWRLLRKVISLLTCVVVGVITVFVFFWVIPSRPTDADVGPGILLAELLGSGWLVTEAFKRGGAAKKMRMPQPGWYADPSGESDLRFWDGTRWTEWQSNK